MKLNFRKSNRQNLLKAFIYMAIAGLCFYVDFACGANTGISGIVGNVQGTFKTFAKFITGAAYLTGLGFALGSVMKFKAHRDNPTQVPIGMPIVLMFVAMALLFLPYLFGQIGTTVFGSGKSSGVSGWSGIRTS